MPPNSKAEYFERGSGSYIKGIFSCQECHLPTISTFEHLDTSYRVIVVYRPPPSVKNGNTEEQFIDEFSDKLINCSTAHQNLLVIGDFNINMDKPDSPLQSKFTHLLVECALSQLVKDPTHCMGHILDLVMTRSDNSPVHSLSVYDLGKLTHQNNKLDNPHQSAYKPGHSTETALLSIKNEVHLWHMANLRL